MSTKSMISFSIGFGVLFFVYHFPEFFSAFWIMAAFKIGFLVVAFLIARWQGWKGLGGYGLGLSGGWAAQLMKGLVLGLLFFSLSVLFAVLSGYQEISAPGLFKNILDQLPMILLMTVFPSVAEDILTRGYLYAHIKRIPPMGWIILSAVIYVLNHIWRLQEGPAVLTYLFALGLVLALAVWITRSLWLAFGIHWGANIAFESGHSMVQTKELVQHDGPTWLLALSWALLFMILVIFNFSRISQRVVPAAKKD